MTPDERAKIAAMMGVATPRFVDGDPRSATAPSLVPKGWKPDTSRRVSTIDQMFNGTGIPERLGLLNSMFNPVTAMQEAGQHSEDMFAPGKTGWERVGSLGGMLSGVAGVVAPVAGAKLAGGKTVDALVESLTGVSTAPRAMAGEFMADEFGGVKLPFGGKDEGFTAYHGSPHDFDKFSMDKIGTGEGAQAYGHGLYFAEAEDTAKAYRDQLQFPRIDGASTPVEKVADDLNYHRGNVEGVKKIYEGMLASGDEAAKRMAQEKLAALPEAVDRFKGRMYEVDINANPEDFLDWDAPLSAQPQSVRDALAETGYVAPEGSDIGNMSGRMAYAKLAGGTNDTAPATEALRAKGIPGIKYLDAGSRGADGDGSRNYVVFDEKIISIVRKYGIAAAAAMLGWSQADVVQASGIKDEGQAKTNAAIAKMVRPQ